ERVSQPQYLHFVGERIKAFSTSAIRGHQGDLITPFCPCACQSGGHTFRPSCMHGTDEEDNLHARCSRPDASSIQAWAIRTPHKCALQSCLPARCWLHAACTGA